MSFNLFVPRGLLRGIKFDVRELFAEMAEVLGEVDTQYFLSLYIEKLMRELGYPCAVEMYVSAKLMHNDILYWKLKAHYVSETTSMVDRHLTIIQQSVLRVLKEIGYCGEELIIGRTHHGGSLLIVYKADHDRPIRGWS